MTTSSKQLEVRPFLVQKEWVKISFKIPSKLAEFLNSRTETIRRNYGMNIYNCAIPFKWLSEHDESEISEDDLQEVIRQQFAINPKFAHGNLQGMRSNLFTVSLEKWQWEKTVLVACRLLKCTPESFARAVLHDRRNVLRRLDER